MSAIPMDDAYRHCQRVAREQARNFYYGIRLLPPPKRDALCAVYAFARRIDDIGDDAGRDRPAEERLRELRAAREQLAAVARGEPGDDPVLVALAGGARRYPLPLDAFGELIDGVEADVRGRTYSTFDELVTYCRCVAGSIGRLSLGVFGSRDPAAAAPLADSLGVAMQLTNILRDLREDADAGRVYLPASDRERFGCDGAVAGGPALARLVRYEADRAGHWFDTGLGLLPLLDRRSAACVAAMAGIYRRLLDRIAAHPEQVVQHRVALPPWEKAMVAARSLTGRAS